MRGNLGNAFLVFAIAAFVGAVAWAFSSSQEKEYGSSMQLEFSRLVSPELQSLGPVFAEPDIKEEVRLDTAARNVDSIDVADATAKRNPRFKMTGGEIASRVQASPIRGTLIVEVTAQAPNAFVAAVLVKSYVREYLDLRREQQGRRILTVQNALKKRLEALPKADKATFRGVGLRDQIATLGLIRRIGTGTPTVVQEPRINASPVKPKVQRDTMFGVLFGLAVGAGLVALRSGARSRAAVAAARAVAARSEAPRQHR
jgi:uncharacterized protein involved in exopolysaccharide biosynthesis